MYATNYHRQVMKNLPDNPKPTRRAFVKKAAASTVASGALLSGCGPQSDEPSKPKLNSLYDDPHSPVNLPGRDDYRRPPNWGPSVRANWDAKTVIVIMLDSFRADHLGALGGVGWEKCQEKIGEVLRGRLILEHLGYDVSPSDQVR